MNSAVSRLSRDFFIKNVDAAVWHENGAGELGVCTIVACPRGFFVYARGGLDKQPIESRVSATCSPDF